MFGQPGGRLLLYYFSSWLVKGAHGLDLPGIAGVSWLRLARIVEKPISSKSTGRGVGRRKHLASGVGAEIRSLGFGDTRFHTAYFVIRGAFDKHWLLLYL